MLKEIVIAIQAYRKAYVFIGQHQLGKWILIPQFIYMILFFIGLYFFAISADGAVSHLSQWIGVDHWLRRQHSAALSFIFLMSGIMVRLIMMFFYYSLFKYLFLILGSPVFAYISQKTEAIIEKREFIFNKSVWLQDVRRGITLALRNCLWQTVYTVSILILSFIPVIGWITPVISGLTECYFFGFSMLDYSCTRHNLSLPESIHFIGQRRGLALGNGLFGMFVPPYALVAASISLYHQNLDS